MTKAELEGTARQWQEIVRAKTQEISHLQVARARADSTASGEQLAAIVALVEERARLLERFALVIDSLERKGGDPDLVAELRAYRKAILFEETSQASFKALAGSFLEWLGRADGGIALLIRIAIAGLALLAIIFVARLLRSVARLWIGHATQLSKLLQGFIVAVLYWVFIIIGLAIVLSSVDVDITPMFAVIGGASFILAFAFQDTLGNLASGLMIMINQPFDEGDFIEVGGVGGTVRKVTMVGTTVATPDNRIVVVPNKNVWGNVIVNASASDTRRVDLVFSASYDDPIQTVLKVISEQVIAHPKVLSNPPPEIRPSELGTSAVQFVCRPWVQAADYWDVHCDLTQTVKEAFDDNGLSMPYPQQDVHVKSMSSAGSATPL
ncbi:mechanosensitive ion channel family protein [Qipengyuania zhejiangensis]|uniref:mechanosensitive ion channel family protein n=1 Tax=Qipengyuania zhejiangensis TaxID=3077782 RepID=UPI002D764E4D|nr:mechanosensitive ion channel family protein [Qipengyuania sp. Z2]